MRLTLTVFALLVLEIGFVAQADYYLKDSKGQTIKYTTFWGHNEVCEVKIIKDDTGRECIEDYNKEPELKEKFLYMSDWPGDSNYYVGLDGDKWKKGEGDFPTVLMILLAACILNLKHFKIAIIGAIIISAFFLIFYSWEYIAVSFMLVWAWISLPICFFLWSLKSFFKD